MNPERLAGWGSLLLVGLTPFHAFLTVWAGHLFGYMAVWQGWKEAVILVAGLATLLYVRRNPRVFKPGPLAWAMLVYAIYTLAYLLIADNQPAAELLALKTNLVFLAAFLVAARVKDKAFKRLAQKILLSATAVASLFMLAQNTILPANFLEYFGYGPATVPPYLPYNSLLRFPSTLGGPNQLGAFLILPIALTLKLCLRQRRPWQIGLLGLELSALVLTYSRSAWLGAIAAMAVIIWLETDRRYHRVLALAGTAAILLIAGLALRSGSTALVRGGLQPNTSDAERIGALQDGAQTVLRHPLGLGPGSAGPASFKDDQPLITENYYLQLAVEVGVIGLILFMAIQYLLAKQLWRWRHLPGLGGPLLASLVGVGIVNLFLHGWADSTTALTYWTLAGLTYGGAEKVDV